LLQDLEPKQRTRLRTIDPPPISAHMRYLDSKGMGPPILPVMRYLD
jgi:hypothetical protein